MVLLLSMLREVVEGRGILEVHLQRVDTMIEVVVDFNLADHLLPILLSQT